MLGNEVANLVGMQEMQVIFEPLMVERLKRVLAVAGLVAGAQAS